MAFQDADARDRDGDPVVVAVGAHYRSQAITKEDLLLHVVNVSPRRHHPSYDSRFVHVMSCLNKLQGVRALLRDCQIFPLHGIAF